jgi:hypothetical protein
MSAKRVVGRGLAIGLGIICIILMVGMVGTMAYYTMAINDKNAAYDGYVSSHSHTNSDYNTQVSSLDAQIISLNTQIANLTEIVNLAKSTTWSNAFTRYIGPYESLGLSAGGETDYAGYLAVKIESSTVSNIYVRVIYSSHGLNYDQQVTVGSGGTAIFPILPTHDVEVEFGNPNAVQAIVTSTITYYY